MAIVPFWAIKLCGVDDFSIDELTD